jgi:H+/gluconate symporter-like permease
MDPVKQFNDTASSYGLGIAVLLAVSAGLILILWKLGNRLIVSHENFLAVVQEQQKEQKQELEKQTTVLSEIRAALPTICRAGVQPANPRRPRSTS